MKNIGLCILALGISTSAFGSACVQGGTLASYATAGSCTFTGSGQTYTLQDFTFLAVNLLTPGVGAGDFTLTESVGANGPSVMITPDGATAISSILAGTETLLFGFDITSNNASIGFSAVNLSEQSALTSPLLGIGSTGLIAEEDCFGGALPAPNALLSLGSGGLACLGGGLSVGASIALAPGVGVNASVPIQLGSGFTNSVDVLKEINLTAVGNILTLTPGTAAITGIGQSFTTQNAATAPEPGSFFLGGCGLVGVAMALRRKAKGGAKA
jgi:hypothetical protein